MNDDKPNGHDHAEMETDARETIDDLGPCEKWDRQRNEPPRAFEAFKLWLHAEKRSLSDVARSSNFECSVANISRWSRIHRWQDRAWAYDLAKEEEQRRQLARDRTSMRTRHLQVALALQGICAHSIREMQAKIASGSPLGLTPEETKGLLDMATKLEQRTLGPEDERSRYTQVVVNLGTYEDEEQYENALMDGGGMSLPSGEEVN